ncbi:hypothetical protein BJ741DRAFT_651160, partial [Chytriomyces cf. hyalinus JEL632]
MYTSKLGPASLQTPPHESKVNTHYDFGHNAAVDFTIEVPQRTASLSGKHRDAPQSPMSSLFMQSDSMQAHGLPYQPQAPGSPSATSVSPSISSMDTYSLFQKVTTALAALKRGKMPKNSEARRVFKSIRILLNSVKDEANMSRDGLAVVALLEQLGGFILALVHLSDEFMKKRNPGSQLQNMVENLTSIVQINEDDPSGIFTEKSQEIREAAATLLRAFASSLMAKDQSQKMMAFFHVLAEVFYSDASMFSMTPSSSRQPDVLSSASHAAPTRAGGAQTSGDVFSRATLAAPTRGGESQPSGDVFSRATHAPPSRAGEAQPSGDEFSRATHAAPIRTGETPLSGDVLATEE